MKTLKRRFVILLVLAAIGTILSMSLTELLWKKPVPTALTAKKLKAASYRPTPAAKQAAPASDRPTPAAKQAAPASDRPTPADKQEEPASDRPAEKKATPASDLPTFVRERLTPAVYRQTQARNRSIPSRKPPATWLECEGGRERKHIAFPKNHKVAGSTVMTILSRYAYTRHLNVITPRPFVPSRLYPYRLYPEHYMPLPPNQTFDMLMYHTVYNRTRFHQLLPKDTLYVTIIRKPLNHLKSAWTFYNYGGLFRINETVIENPLAQFLTDPGRYDKRCGHGMHYPLCLTQNSISVDLGFPPEYNKNVTLGSDPDMREKLSRTFVQTIDQDFDLVMLTEYFDESLVLLKRLMCWTIQDILYITSTNIQRHKLKDISPELKQKHKEWSYVDYALYDHFNKSFWKRIKSTGNDFPGEVKYFKDLNAKIQKFCRDPCLNETQKLVLSRTQWSPELTINSDFCLMLRRNVYCHISVQAERVGKSLWLTSQNASFYGYNTTGNIDANVKMAETWQNHMVMELVEPYCVYCKMNSCLHLDYLAHFYRDGYVGKEAYQATRHRLCDHAKQFNRTRN